jgi:hypothetical protein
MWQRFMLIACGISLMTPAFAGPLKRVHRHREDDFAYTERELKIQDAAFALLMETFRQFRSCEIEKFYQQRLNAAAVLEKKSQSPVVSDHSEAERKLKEFVGALSTLERHLEHEKLQTQMVNCNTAYHCVRQFDEHRLGQTVVNSSDRRAAAAQLQAFVIVTDGPLRAVLSNKASSIPADAVLLDAEELPLPSPKVVPPNVMTQSWSTPRSPLNSAPRR